MKEEAGKNNGRRGDDVDNAQEELDRHVIYPACFPSYTHYDLDLPTGVADGDTLDYYWERLWSERTPFTPQQLAKDGGNSVILPDYLLEDLQLEDWDSFQRGLGYLAQLISRANKYGQAGKYEKAVHVCGLGLILFPEQIELYALLIGFCGKAKYYDKAKAYMNEAIHLHPNTSCLNFYLNSIDALIAEDARRNEEALMRLLKAMKENIPGKEIQADAERRVTEALG